MTVYLYEKNNKELISIKDAEVLTVYPDVYTIVKDGQITPYSKDTYSLISLEDLTYLLDRVNKKKELDAMKEEGIKYNNRIKEVDK